MAQIFYEISNPSEPSNTPCDVKRFIMRSRKSFVGSLWVWFYSFTNRSEPIKTLSAESLPGTR
jgi:hypothetical protein